MSQARVPNPPGFDARCGDLAQRLTLLPDKPQETAGTTLMVLWLLAAGEPLSVELAEERTGIHTLDAAAQTRLDALTAQQLALSLVAGEPRAQVLASDMSGDAVVLARRNARNAVHLGLAERIDWRVGDLLDPFDEPAIHGSIDLLVCNPPASESTRCRTRSSVSNRASRSTGALSVCISCNGWFEKHPAICAKADGWRSKSGSARGQLC